MLLQGLGQDQFSYPERGIRNRPEMLAESVRGGVGIDSRSERCATVRSLKDCSIVMAQHTHIRCTSMVSLYTLRSGPGGAGGGGGRGGGARGRGARGRGPTGI